MLTPGSVPVLELMHSLARSFGPGPKNCKICFNYTEAMIDLHFVPEPKALEANPRLKEVKGQEPVCHGCWYAWAMPIFHAHTEEARARRRTMS